MPVDYLSNMQPSLLQIGTVLRPHGVRGELRIRLHNPDSAALDSLTRLWLLPPSASASAVGRQAKEWKLEAARALPEGCYLVSLEGLDDRTQAEKLRAFVVFARREDLSALAADEVYLADLVGLQARTVDGEALGQVMEVIDLKGNSLLSIQRPDRSELLLPAVAEVLVTVDFEARAVVVDPPSGLVTCGTG